MSSSTNPSSNNWRNPSAAHMQKYNLRALPDDFEPTDEERGLLNMYDVVRNYEREAARLREEAARAKLAAADAEFQSKLAPKRIRRKKQKTYENPDEDLDDSDDDIESEEEEEDEEQTRRERQEAKLAELREQVEQAKQQTEQNDEQETAELRAKLLGESTTFGSAGPDDADDTPMLRRKRKLDADEQQQKPASSLIANLTAAVTPPHDFSSSLELANRGTVLFPGDTTDSFKWSPPEGVFSPNDGALQLDLKNFDVNRAQDGAGNNTVAVKFMAPMDSKRFSINIAGPNHDDFNSVLFHFNPRSRERGGQLVVNDKQDGDWGQAIQIPLSQMPLMFGQTACTLVVQITGEGFDVFVENQHCARLEHRTELPSGNINLVLQFPSTDDRGSPENWVVYKVWWGNKPIMAKGDVSGIAGVNSYISHHPRKLFISSLSKIFTEAEVDLRRAELERAFRKYGGDRGVDVIVPTNTTYAFVEMESERMAEMALTEMADKYRMNRARRSRHEALKEERAAAEAAKLGGAVAKEDSAW